MPISIFKGPVITLALLLYIIYNHPLLYKSSFLQCIYYLLTALTAAIKGADVHNDLADAQSVVASAGDHLADVAPAGDNYVDTDGNRTDRAEATVLGQRLPTAVTVNKR